MKLPKRFAISTLLQAMLLVSLVLGYAQWRRQWITEEVQRLSVDGKSAIFAWEFGFGESGNHTSLAVNGSFWPQVVDQPLRLLVFKNQRGEYHFAGEEPRPIEEMKLILSSLRSRLQRVGFTSVNCASAFPRKKDGSRRMKHFRLESLGAEAEKQY